MEFQSKNDSGSLIGTASIIENSDLLLTHLDNKEWYLPHIEKMSEHRRQEWLSVRLLLKQLLGEEKEIRYQFSGKPYLADNSSYISISHTKGYVAVILNKEKEVAIDIEKISSRVKNIRTRFISEEEEKAIFKDNELIHLLLHWSAKESIFKIINEDNVTFQSQFHVFPFQPVINEWATFAACETRTILRNNYIVKYFVHEKYVLTYI